MALINPEHLFEQADGLVATQVGRPRQADVRRAISAAYYGVFHAIITQGVNLFVGATNQNSKNYGLAYRSVDHAWLRELCREVQKQTLPNRFRPYEPNNGFGPNIQAFAIALVDLQEKRHVADYDITATMRQSDAVLAVKTARAALRRFSKASKTRRNAFLGLLLFRPR